MRPYSNYWNVLMLIRVKFLSSTVVCAVIVAFFCGACTSGKKVQVNDYAKLIDCH